jgi:hypothetical protein
MARATATPAARPRTALDTTIDALPDLLACIGCASALIEPDWPGFDLLRTSGLLFFIELPLALLALFAGVQRLSDRDMSRGTKSGFVVVPTLILALFALLLLGGQGLLAVVWLSAASLYRIATGAPARAPAIPGFWITYTQGDGEQNASVGGISMSISAGKRRGKPTRQWKVQGGAEQLEAGMTATLWFVIAGLLLFLPLSSPQPSAEYAAQVGWSTTLLGQLVPPAKALWGGAILFAVRFLSHLDFVFEAPAPAAVNVEDDPLLREIVSKIDGDSPTSAPGAAKKRRRKRR